MGSLDLTKKYYGLLVILATLYLIVSFTTEPNPFVLARFHMDATQFRLLSLSIALLLVLVWYAAFYGLIHLTKYANKIKDSPDGNGFRWLAAGTTVIVVGLPLNSLVSTILSRGIPIDLISQATATIISTHLAILFPLVGFFFVVIGSYKLIKTLKKVRISSVRLMTVTGILITISAFYIYAALHNPAREVAVPPALTATYYMQDWLIITTIIIPYIFMWTCGFYATLWLRAYEQSVGGVFYKRALKKLNKGFLIVILTSILLQFLTAAVTSIFAWQIGTIALLVYILVFIIGIGYLSIALGSKDLSKLEEIR